MSWEKIKLLINNSQTNNSISKVTASIVEENQNIFEENKTSYDALNPEFDDNWEDVQYSQNKALGFLWNKGTYTYTTSNGSTITVKNTDSITVKQNKQTGEIVIIGGNIEDVNLSGKNNLTLIEATAKNINASTGDATIKIEGTHTSVANIKGGKGSQSVIVSAGAKVEHINTGDDDDAVIINNSQVGKVETGIGNDGVITYNSNITNNVNLGKNDDYLLVTDTSIQGKVTTGKGNDTIDGSNAEFKGEINSNSSDKDTNTINLENSKINDDIIAYNGNADIIIKDGSTLAENKKIETGYGDYNISVDNSNLDGNLVASGYDGQGNYGTFNLNLNNSSLNNVSGLRNDDNTTFNSHNSKSNGAENVESANNSKKEVQNLNTTEGEFQDYELINPENVDTRKTYTVKISDTQTKTVSEEEWKQVYSGCYQLLSENVQNVYTLSDGTIVSMNEGGQLYTNKQGDIVINGADKAEITAGNNANGKITVINSYVLSHNNVHGSIEYRNSNVDTISVSDVENAQISLNDDSKIGDLTSSNSNLTVNISDTSKINNLVSSDEGVLNINSNGGEISKIQSDKADIIGNIQNSTIGTIKTQDGSIDITASGSKNSQTGEITYCRIDKIENNNKDGETKLNLTYTVSDKISSKSKSEINLDNCKITSKITSSDYQDLINIIDSEVKNLEAKQGDDNLYIQESSFDKLTASEMTEITLDRADIKKLNIQGDIAVYKSEIDDISVFGNIAIKASEINDLNVSGDISNVDIKDSLIKNSNSLRDDNAHIDYFGNETNYGNLDETQLDIASSQLEKLSEQELEDVYTLLESLENGDSETISELKSQNLSREEIIKKLNENPSVAIAQIKQGLIDEMQGAITTLEQALEDDKASGGSWWLTSIINSISNDINASNIQSKKEMLSKAVESGDIESLLNAHTVLTDEISATNAIKEYNDALNYSSSISQDDIGKVLTTLGYIGNLMEYNITEQDGVIKEGIAYLNMYFDIGTNRKEAEAYVQTFKDDVNNLVKKYQNGTLTNEELVSEYKRLTGNSFTENNIRTILDNVRDNDAFENNAQEKTQDYQQTQQTIMQVGEYTITIVAGTAVTLVSGGAAGPAIAAGLSALGKMGIALTATTVSFITKTAIEATERQTNGITADDMTPEEIATSAALMYAGCLCGQFGNAVGDYIQGAAPKFLSQYISSNEMVNIVTKVAGKTLEIGSDTAASVLTTSMITGSGEWNEEFMQNLRSEMIGLIQSKITGAYFKAHPDLQINTQLYSMRKGLAGATEAEANIQVLKQFGFSDNDAVKLSTLTNDEVDTIVLLKATNDLCEASLKSHGIDISKLSAEEKIEQGKIVDDLYANADKIKQQTDNTCSVVSVLNAISDKPILLQALANKFEYDAANDTYKFNMFGEEFDVKMKDGDNLLQKAYEAYQIQYGDTKTSAIDVFNAMLDGSCDILVRPNNDIVQTLKEYTEDDSSILTFNTSDKIDGISSGHSYTVLSVDDMGNMHLQDPYTLEEITLIRSDYENKDCQIQGKTYKDSGIVENGVELKLAAGAKISDEELTIKYMEMDTAQKLAYLKDNSEFSRNLTKSEADFVLQEDFSPEEIQKMLDLLDNPEYKDTLSLSNGEHISHIIKEDLSAAETKKYVETVRLENFWDNTIISIKNYNFWSFYYSTVEQSIGEWLSTTFGVKPADIKQDALKFALKLNPKIIQKLTRFGRHNDYLANLLRKEDVFYDTDFDAISKNADFINYLSETTVDGKNLLSQVNNVAFLINKDFDTEGMTKLIETFKNIRITQPETNKYNFSMFLNLADGYNSITDILNSSTVDPYKAAEFLETLASTKITKSNGVQWSFTDILKEKWLYDSLFDKTIDYDKVTELCKYISELNMFPNLDEDDMSQIKWLVSNVSTTKYSNSHEYLDAYIYFKNLTADNKNKIFTGRYGRMSQEGILYYMLNINPGSVEASNAEMLIRLVQDGVVGKHIFEYLPSGGKLSPTVESDLDKLYEAYSLGIEPIDAFVPKFKSAAEAVMGGNDSISFKDTYLEVKVGDVFQVEGEDFIRIKTSDTESEQLNITRETYFKLFPPIERFASTQNDIGNCWEITGINSLLCESDTRASVLKLFSQDGDDIVIKFPNGEYEEIRFKNGELPETANNKYYSQGALGIKMLEYADGKEMQGELINKAYKKIKDMIANAPNNNTRESFEKGLAEFTKFVENHDENICINFINGVHWEEYSGRFDNIISDLRNDGGQSNNLYAKLGYKDAKCLCIYNNDGSWEKAQKLLKDSSSFDDYIISWASDGNGIENSVNSELGIVTNHAYRIKPATINNDGTVATFKLINPWGIVETELTYEQVLKYGKALYIAKKEF